MDQGISCLVNIGRKVRDYFEKRAGSDPWTKATIEFDNALRKFLALNPTPANGKIQFMDDDIMIAIAPVPEQDEDETETEEKSKNND
jgi:hypothetical protein